jgi:putative ABC transport system permease protein
MNKLVVGNVLYRPLRTAISVFAVAIEVVMILSIVAIMVGMVQGAANQAQGTGADLIVRPPSASFISAGGGAPEPAKVSTVLAKLPHVAVAAPVFIKLDISKAVQQVFGIQYSTYNALRPFQFLAGGPFNGPNDVIVDDLYAKSHHTRVGETIELIGHPFRVSGIVEHGKGARLFVPIQTMGEIMASPGNATVFYLRSDSLSDEGIIEKEIETTPGFQNWGVMTMAEEMSMMTPAHMPGFNIALNTVIVIAVIVGFLVIFQSMYTSVMERTREIGILKSLGGSKLYIMNLVLREAALVTVVGIGIGFGFAQLLKVLLAVKFPTLPYMLTGHWRLEAAGIALVGSLLGALYPAWTAARKDPIEALAYE